MNELIKPLAEQRFQDEIEILKNWDEQNQHPRPHAWQLSPQAVVKFIVGGMAGDKPISAKYFGADRAVQVAVATLTTDRALLLYGPPGTGKSTLSELLAAAICGNSQLIVQGTAGISEEKVLYEWDYAYRLSKGTDTGALVKTPIFRAMEEGKLARIEELTRIPSDVQDALITILSEKMMPIPDKDKGVNDLSKALSRRFNTVRLELPDDEQTEIQIVEHQVGRLCKAEDLPLPINLPDEIKRVVRIFRELRDGQSGSEKIEKPSATLSPAEAISVISQAISMSAYFGGDDSIQAEHIASGLEGVVVREAEDRQVFRNYTDRILKNRAADRDLDEALRQIL